jgi:hypothetical protein
MTAINNAETISGSLPEFLNMSLTPRLLSDAQEERWPNYRSIGLPIATLFAFGFQCEISIKKIAAPVTARRKRRWKIRGTDSTAWWIASVAIKKTS